MEKKMDFLGVSKGIFKKTKKKRMLNKVVDYLKSDFYMFAPLISYPPFDISPAKRVSAFACIGVEEPNEGRKKNLLNMVEEYLKSDLYMYAPLVDSQSSKVNSGPPLDTSLLPREIFKEIDTSVSPREILKEIDTSVSPREILTEIEQPSKGIAKAAFNKSAVVRQTIAQRETVKHKLHHNHCSSSLPGKQVRETRQRKLVK